MVVVVVPPRPLPRDETAAVVIAAIASWAVQYPTV